VRGSGPGEQEVPAQMDADDEVPVLVGHAEQHPVAQDAGVVDHDVQPAQLHRRGDQRVGRRPLADVATDEGGLPAEPLDVPHDRIAGGVDIVEHDVSARSGERQCLGPAEPGTRSGDDRDLAP
jgi:hypothetical protein